MAKSVEVKVPDIGEFSDVEIVELLVAVGDRIEVETPLITLESDKASIEVPSSAAGVVRALRVAVGDRVSEGDVVAEVEEAASDGPEGEKDSQPSSPAPRDEEAKSPAEEKQAPEETKPAKGSHREPAPPKAEAAEPRKSEAHRGATPGPEPTSRDGGPKSHASPAVRRFARELGAELHRVHGTGRKGRITRDDITEYVKSRLAQPAAAAEGGSGIPPIPEVDFSEFGPIETLPLPRIKKISGPFLHRSWLNIPHVTHHDEADITGLDAFRREVDEAAKKDGYRITLLSFLMKAVAHLLEHEMPEVGSSLSADGQSLILKKYVHIGVAVDTPKGLVVPVVRDVDRKGIRELSKRLGELSAKARDGKLSPKEMQGGCFSISSLGGIGGTGFTPIVNAPEVAILGVTKAKMAPVWDGSEFVPRLMLPLSLSYDHRVVDGAAAARFVARLAALLTDPRRLLL